MWIRMAMGFTAQDSASLYFSGLFHVLFGKAWWYGSGTGGRIGYGVFLGYLDTWVPLCSSFFFGEGMGGVYVYGCVERIECIRGGWMDGWMVWAMWVRERRKEASSVKYISYVRTYTLPLLLVPTTYFRP